MLTNSKLQMLLIKHLNKYGSIKLTLPDGVVLQIGVNQLDSAGRLRKAENYCWVIASREDRMAVLDSYNLGLRYSAEDTKKLIFEDEIINSDGCKVKQLDLI